MTRPIAYLGNDTLLTMTKFGRKIYVDGRDLSIAPHILMQGDWESWITSFLQRKLLQRDDEPGAFVLDVGANVGWYSLASYFVKEGVYKTYAFEPNPRLAELLRRTFAVNGLREKWVYEVAVGERAGQAQIAWRDADFGGGSLVKVEGVPDGPGVAGVGMIALDDAVNPGSRVALIKIDVEGHEPQVLRGAKRILQENPAIDLLVEHHKSQDEHDVIQWLIDQEGFGISHIGIDSNEHPISSRQAAELPDAEMLYLTRR
jgi:FkbM family methyltransferase